jgi:SpoVK/Ycf46/Vps4 family AAA+-type ATPase
VDVAKVAAKTDGFSGADLKGLVDLAVEGKLAEAMKTGRPVPLTTKDLLAAAKTSRGSTKEWFGTAKNYALYANQGGIYDDIVRYMKLG